VENLARTSLAALVLVLLAACGGSGSPQEEAESAVKETAALEDVQYDHARCVDAGWMTFVGERETVWDCRYGYEAAPEEWHDCFVVVDGKAEEVTGDLIRSEETWPCVEALGG
jgi:hypothetical protein